MTDRKDGEAPLLSVAMTSTYHEHILDASDVCSNCHRKNRVERVDPVMSRTGLRHELDSHYSRDQRNTTVEYHDGGDKPTEAKGVFCECGTEGGHTRHWSPDDVSREKFKALLKHTARTLAERGVSVDRRTMFSHALSHFDDCGDVDRALAAGVDIGIATATAQSDTDTATAD